MLNSMVLPVIASLLLQAPAEVVPAPSSRAAASDTIKILVVTGGPAHYHQTELVPTSFYTLFEGHAGLAWDHATADEAAFASDLRARYDVLVMYNRSDSLSAAAQENLRAFVEGDKGIVVLHHALGSYNGWPWWWREVVGGKYQMNDGEVPSSSYSQGERIDARVAARHPITSAAGPFEFEDETYRALWISPEAEVLYRTTSPTSDGPLVWVSPYRGSRVVAIQPGHASPAHRDDAYRSLIHSAIMWAAGKSSQRP